MDRRKKETSLGICSEKGKKARKARRGKKAEGLTNPCRRVSLDGSCPIHSRPGSTPPSSFHPPARSRSLRGSRRKETTSQKGEQERPKVPKKEQGAEKKPTWAGVSGRFPPYTPFLVVSWPRPPAHQYLKHPNFLFSRPIGRLSACARWPLPSPPSFPRPVSHLVPSLLPLLSFPALSGSSFSSSPLPLLTRPPLSTLLLSSSSLLPSLSQHRSLFRALFSGLLTRLEPTIVRSLLQFICESCTLHVKYAAQKREKWTQKTSESAQVTIQHVLLVAFYLVRCPLNLFTRAPTTPKPIASRVSRSPFALL